jgi:hypothetical protein
MHFHVLRLVVICIIIFLVIHYNVWDYAVKQYDAIHARIMSDVRATQMQYFHHY